MNADEVTKWSRRIGLTGIVLLLAGILLLLYSMWHVEAEETGTMVEFLAYCAFLFAGLWGSRKWLFFLFASPISFFV